VAVVTLKLARIRTLYGPRLNRTADYLKEFHIKKKNLEKVRLGIWTKIFFHSESGAGHHWKKRMERWEEVALASTDGTWKYRKKEEMERWEERRIKGQKE
jgi:hypothetical protein